MSQSDKALAAGPALVWSDRLIRNLLFAQLGKMHTGELLVEADGEEFRFGPGGDVTARVTVNDPAVYAKLCFGGSVGVGEAYFQGMWHSDDLVEVVRIFVLNEDVLDGVENGLARFGMPLLKLAHWTNRNNRQQAKKNISAHYDLGNEMFSLFLDPRMMYSSAIYPSPNSSLEEASDYKLKRICEKLELKSTDHLIEIGSGWGGLAIFAAQHYGCRVTTTTISREQYDLAEERIRQAGLEHKITLLLKDYRDLQGQYDKLVSVEMIEAVGLQYLPGYFNKCSELLKPEGRMLIQAITIADQRFTSYSRNVDFIQRYIFPGGALPSVSVIAEHVREATNMVITHMEDIGHHYAQTLKDWRKRFFLNQNRIETLGYDDQFFRLWEYYLCYCEGGFRERAISTVQVMMDKPANRNQPPMGAL